MNTIDIIGYQRENLGKKNTKQLRREAYVPGVLYGGKEQMHFYIPMISLRELVYTSKAYFVNLKIEGISYRCILQEIQFHPVSEIILHVDFFKIFENKKIKMAIPVTISGKAVGIEKGGILSKKQRKLWISSFPSDMPDDVTVDISGLDLGQIARVQDIKVQNYTILVLPTTPVASIEIPRSLRSAAKKEEEKSKAKK